MDLTNFAKEWIGVTLAPESIISIQLTPKCVVHKLINESKTKEVYCFEQYDMIIAISDTLDIKAESIKFRTFKQACLEVAERIGLMSVSIP